MQSDPPKRSWPLPGQSAFFLSSRRRHTRLTCDWSSDVCSSDLETRDSRSYLALEKARIENSRPNYEGAVTLSGEDGDDAKHYQEKQVKRAIEEVEK